jgi:hypothetical protein
MEHTPAHEFLSELGDINALILDVLNNPRKAQWHWPSYYLLYVDVDRLAGLLVRVRHLFEPPFEGFGEPPTTEELVESGNELFDLLDKQQKAIIRWLFQMVRYTRPSAIDPAAHQRLGAHVHPKSGWHQVFMAESRAGMLAADGKVLQRTVLPILQGATGERIDEITATCMLRHQSFDISTPAGRLALAQATDEVQVRIGKVSAAMTAFLLANCTISDLLHPCSH